LRLSIECQSIKSLKKSSLIYLITKCSILGPTITKSFPIIKIEPNHEQILPNCFFTQEFVTTKSQLYPKLKHMAGEIEL